MDYRILNSEITNDPRSIGYSTMTHQQIVDSLNAKNITIQEPIISKRLIVWGGKNSRLDSITNATTNTNLSGAVRSVAMAALHMIQRTDTDLDMTDPDITQMFSVMVSASILTSSDSSELIAMSQVSKSWSNQNWGRDVTLLDLTIAGV